MKHLGQAWAYCRLCHELPAAWLNGSCAGGVRVWEFGVLGVGVSEITGFGTKRVEVFRSWASGFRRMKS